MSKSKSKGTRIRKLGTQASASLLMISAVTPALQSVAYGETDATLESAVASQGLTSSSNITSTVEELPQTTIDSSISDLPEASESDVSTPPATEESTTKPSESTGTTSNPSQPGSSTSKPNDSSTTKPSSNKPVKPADKPATSSSSATQKPADKPNSTKVPVTDGAVSYSKNQSTEEFIAKIGNDASKIGDQNDIYASVMIAQAILESASGNSSLAREPNYNLFGIKGSYKGKSVGMPTLEDDGGGNMFSITANFRKYPSYKESLEDYALLIKGGTNSASSFYQGTWKSKTASYREATTYLTGRYATDTRYNQKLNGLIETYDLQRFDDAKKVKKKVKITRHEVVEGETLWEVSKQYGSTIKRIKELNKMSADNSALVPGTVIVVKRVSEDELKKVATAIVEATNKDEKLPELDKKLDQVKVAEVSKAAKEVVLLKLSQVGHSFTNAVPSVLFESKTLKTVGKQVKTSQTHYVVKNESISDISKKHGIPVEKLVEWNNLEDSILTEGQVLIIDSPYNTLV